jgi:phosphate transport system substrate-binding protein
MKEQAKSMRKPRGMKRGLLVRGLLALSISAFDAPLAIAQTLTLAGSTTFNNAVISFRQQKIESLTGLRLVVLPNKSDLGIKLLLEGRVDIAMISVALEPLVQAMRNASPSLPFDQLKSFEVDSAKVAFTVHPTNPVRSMTSAVIAKILLGQITNWKQVGGPDLAIRLVRVDSGAGIPLTLETQLLGGRPITAKDSIPVRISSQVAKIVEQEPGALGLTQATNVRGHNVSVLAVDRSFSQQLSLVTLGNPTPAAASLIAATRKLLETDSTIDVSGNEPISE